MALKTFRVGKVMIDAATLGEVTSASLTITGDVGETTTIGDTWKTNLALGKSWTASVNVLYDPLDTAQAALRTEFISGDCEIASVKFYEDDTKYFDGAAVVTSCAVTKGINAIDTLAISFTGSGALTYN
jgi:predicted secreted protein